MDFYLPNEKVPQGKEMRSEVGPEMSPQKS